MWGWGHVSHSNISLLPNALFITLLSSLLPSSPLLYPVLSSLSPSPSPCTYKQRGISFNQVFGWEMTLLDPREYWRKVPAKWKPYWHFFNSPISADPAHPDSPVRIIKQIANPGNGASWCVCWADCCDVLPLH